MISPTAGAQPDDSKKSPKDFLDDYVSQGIKKLQQQRIPDKFQVTANGAIPQTLDPTNYM